MSTFTGTYTKDNAQKLLRTGQKPVSGHSFALTLVDFGVVAANIYVEWTYRGAIMASENTFTGDTPTATVNFNTTQLIAAMAGLAATRVLTLVCTVYDTVEDTTLCQDRVPVSNTASGSGDPTPADGHDAYMRKDVYDTDEDGRVDNPAYDADMGTW